MVSNRDQDTAAMLHLWQRGVTEPSKHAVREWKWDRARAQQAESAAMRHIRVRGGIKPSGEDLLVRYPQLEALTYSRRRDVEQELSDERPLGLDTRRRAVRALLQQEKYRRPFVEEEYAAFSIVGTEDWQDYASLVVQIVQAETLLNIESKLDTLLEMWSRAAPIEGSEVDDS